MLSLEIIIFALLFKLLKLGNALGKHFHGALSDFILIYLIIFTHNKLCFLTVGSALPCSN